MNAQLPNLRSQRLHSAITEVPPGAWAVAVSGGADSVALLMLLHARADLSLHVVHLDHQTRCGESATDAVFVSDLSHRHNLPCTIRRRSEIESTMDSLPQNLSARYRAARMEFFKQVVQSHNLQGVILAHHADDQAETILHRILRGSGPATLAGMSSSIMLATLRLLRPLLHVSGTDLRAFLTEIGQAWREDSSNASPNYLRNRLRPIIAADPDLRTGLLELATASERLKHWLTEVSPILPENFQAEALAKLPLPLARESASRWLITRGSPPSGVSRSVCDRLVLMATDAATPARQHFPGRLLISRRRGMLRAEPPATNPASAS